MPPARSLRQRAITNENDENASTTRLTRAKAAALSANESHNGATKKPLQSRKAANLSNTGLPRKRAALGDVSNMTKTENEATTKDGKKVASTRSGLASKSTVQSGGVQKITRTNTSRSVLGAKDSNKREVNDVRRPGSGSGIADKRPRTTAHKSASRAEKATIPEEPPRKKVEIEKAQRTETIEKINKVEKVDNAVVKEQEPETAVIPGGQEVAECVVDLDAEDMLDPLMTAEYVVEIFEYLRELEVKTLPNPNYMEHQEELEWKMRGILVDWLIEVHTRFRLLPETLFLAVNIIDRFLSAEVVALSRLQLVGVAAMFIASKYEEVLSPHVANFSHVADETFSDKEILDAERHILATLNYDISYPNPMNFLRRISKADNYDIETRTIGKYLLEISLLDHRFMPFPQSQVAAASIYFARLIFNRGPWDALLAHYSGYTKEEIFPVFQLMVDYLRRPVVHEAFFKKYASKKFMKASICVRKWAKAYYMLYLGENAFEAYMADIRADAFYLQ